MDNELKQAADQMVNVALQAVDPYLLIKKQLTRNGEVLQFPGQFNIDLSDYDRIFICGAGKGTAPMTRAMEEILGDYVMGGDIIVKYDHIDKLQKIKLHEAAHPVPDINTIKATKQLLNNLESLTEKDCVFVLLTGGGSALMEILPDEIQLVDLQGLSTALLACGASIHEINCIRKHISLVKGGQLARFIHPARCITLALSDVIGDDLSVIASGPTSPDPSTFEEAMNILEKYAIENKIPPVVLDHLQKGVRSELPETPKANDKIFRAVSNIVIGNNRLALIQAEKKARSLGYHSIILTSLLEGEAKEIARVIASIIKEIQLTNKPLQKPACVLLGGEPTVHITGDGKGGRNQELALAVALCNIEEPYIFVSCGSDGTDGPTDAAGAIVDHTTLKRLQQTGIDAQRFLKNNDSYHLFSQLGDLIKTGPTGTNVMDIIFALIP
jgi:glycerate 2-kinase